MEPEKPVWPNVRCTDCGTEYEIDEPKVIITINDYTKPIIQTVCPNCESNKFETQTMESK